MQLIRTLTALAKTVVPKETIVSPEKFIELASEFGMKEHGVGLPQHIVDYILEIGGSYGGEGAAYHWSSQEIE